MNIYEQLIKNRSSLKVASEDTSGFDSFLGDRLKLSSLGDLLGFSRIGFDTLVHKAEKDLWRIGEDESGQVIIERLFDPTTKEPLRV